MTEIERSGQIIIIKPDNMKVLLVLAVACIALAATSEPKIEYNHVDGVSY